MTATTVIIAILLLSSLFQFAAALYALFLIRITGRKTCWILISLSLFLMGFRRVIPLYYIYTNTGYTADMTNEIFGLVLSLLMFIGVRGIGPIFIESRRSEHHKALLCEKELILKEVHHRIKNNMNTVKDLLALQAISSDEPTVVKLLQDAGNRVYSMILLYDKLYQSSNYKDVSVREYISSLVDQIIRNFPNGMAVKIRKKIDDFTLCPKKIQPMGIIITELLTNIMKHAFVGISEAFIFISVLLTGNLVTMRIEDNGKPLPESVDFEHSKSFGLMLIGMLTKQLDGNILVERNDPTRVTLEFER